MEEIVIYVANDGDIGFHSLHVIYDYMDKFAKPLATTPD